LILTLVKKAAKTAKGYSVTVQNNGGFPAPFNLEITHADGTTESIHQTPSVWAADQKQTLINFVLDKEVTNRR